ncbi:TRAP-type mannitol/chloroaromatic compound transport system permease small subunit [Phyllobacterium trifolii]|jgi:TRAP-type mannitol/chloroaromatic compound transport system permease small subunit|uniref:TRAP transporter small permease protein n=1 Tax=Phyllobacterium trifolii TaxID=300193 RepID=A0A839UF21_9HYPH|nr:TRAP transporter small permease subunit [Phyllobacterium trifolii]MBB3147442.1 TRAP-type mannitol/chloroaromatic compound transport system permease small subunit [Phyllobacterium trifolii]
MSRWLAITGWIDEFNRRIAIVAIYFVLFASLVCAFNAFLRYSIGTMIWLDHNVGVGGLFRGILAVYGRNSNSLSELQWYLFAGMVMLGGAWTLKLNEHVRVDLVYGSVSERTRTWIDLLGGLFFLLPICCLMIYFTWPWFVLSWVTNEGSSNSGGLPLWPVKLSLPVGFALVGLQGISELIKCYLALTTDYVREFAYEKPVQ